jgi:transcription elongation factor GreA
MAAEPIYLTPEGHRRMREELEGLRKVRRPELVRAIEHARSLGDLSENAEYHAAKEAQVQLERRIGELEERLSRVRELDPRDVPDGLAAIQSFVTFSDVDSAEEETLQLVAAEEADFDSGKLSIISPLGRALVGHGVGEVVEFAAPRGVRKLRIISVSTEKPG